MLHSQTDHHNHQETLKKALQHVDALIFHFKIQGPHVHILMA
jgi:hypothetical protein